MTQAGREVSPGTAPAQQPAILDEADLRRRDRRFGLVLIGASALLVLLALAGVWWVLRHLF